MTFDKAAEDDEHNMKQIQLHNNVTLNSKVRLAS